MIRQQYALEFKRKAVARLLERSESVPTWRKKPISKRIQLYNWRTVVP